MLKFVGIITCWSKIIFENCEKRSHFNMQPFQINDPMHRHVIW